MYRPTFYNEDSALPVYKWTTSSTHFSVEELARILLTDCVPQPKLCTKQPVRVCHNATFVVNLHSLDHQHDVRADENGVWIRKGSPIAYISVHTSGGHSKVFRRMSLGNHPNHYKLTRVYYRHSSSLDFQRIITTVHGKLIECGRPLLHVSISGVSHA